MGTTRTRGTRKNEEVITGSSPSGTGIIESAVSPHVSTIERREKKNRRVIYCVYISDASQPSISFSLFPPRARFLFYRYWISREMLLIRFIGSGTRLARVVAGLYVCTERRV